MTFPGFGVEIDGVVALRKESVDRNSNPGSTTLTFPVALRKESVDRNIVRRNGKLILIMSLSARRAWIEIFLSMGLDGRFKRRSPQGERG